MARIVSLVVLVAILLVIGGLFFRVMANFLLPLFLALLLVVMFGPLYRWFRDRCRGHARIAAVLTTGSGLSETRDGGYSEYARLEAEWVLPLPPTLGLRDAIARDFHGRGRLRLRSGEQVDVVRHQHVRMDRQPGLRRNLPQRRQVPLTVRVVDEDRASVVAALDHVVGEARDRQPGKPGHICSEIGV